MNKTIFNHKKVIAIVIINTLLIMILLGITKLNAIVENKEIKESFEINGEIERYYSNKVQLLELMARDKVNIEFLKSINDRYNYENAKYYPIVIENLMNTKELDDKILNVFLSSRKYEILITHDQWITPKDYDLDKRAWYIELEKSDGSDISTPYIDAITGERIVTISSIIRDVNGELIGSSGFDMKVVDIESIISNVDMLGRILIFDKSGEVVVNSLGSKVTDVDISKISSSLGDGDFTKEKIGDELYTIIEMKELGWYLIVMNETNLIISSDFAYILIYILVLLNVAIANIYIFNMKGRSFKVDSLSTELKKNLERNLPKLIPQSKDSELNKIINALNIYIENDIKNKEKFSEELKEKDKQIERSLSVLTEIKGKILESDSLAEMGNIIADIAHEVNTPLGNSILGVSYIKNEIKSLKNLESENLELAVAHMERSIKFTENGLQKTAELIERFKKVVNSDKYNKKVQFDLKEFLLSIVDELTLQYPRLGNFNIDIKYDGDISIIDNPDAYGEIFKNLISNSLIHGYEDRDFGRISIFITKDNNDLVVIYDDDGVGMTKETSTKVFKPFFSSKRQDGHLGLGMFIVYNIIESRFKGKIVCDSKVGYGTEYKIRIPIGKVI